MDYDIVLIKILFPNKRINGNKTRKLIDYPNIINYLNNKYNDSFSIKETLFRIKYNINEHPICPICGKYVAFNGRSNKIFLSHCSTKCSSLDKDVQEKLKNTNNQKYGVDNVFQSKEIQDKIKETSLKKYGVENAGGSMQAQEKIRETCFARYGVINGMQSNKAKEKYKITCLSKYGVDNVLKCPTVQIKRKNTLFMHYNVHVPSKNDEIKEKIKKTNIRKYRVECVLQNKDIQEKIKKTCIKKYGSIPSKNDNVKDKIKDTSFKNYGVSHWMKLPEYKSHMSIVLSSTIVQEKIISTKRKNHTFNTSKPEEELYLYIKKKFPSVERQYNKDIRYPWCCDFYIPEFDYFIGLNGSWTHGGHPYSQTSNEDKLILDKWKERSKEHPYYNQAIKTWTIYDVEKRNNAKENNLNFKEVWSLNEGKLFVDFLYENQHKKGIY